MNKSDLITYLDETLRISEIADYGPQGLQVEAETDEIKRIALAVDVAPVIIENAADWDADMLLVHHGIFWGPPQCLNGPLGKRVRLLLKHDMHLYAAHLALDAHPTLGNNAVLAELLNLQDVEFWGNAKGTLLGTIGTLKTPVSISDLVPELSIQLDATVHVLAHGEPTAQRIAILSGGGADRVGEAMEQGADTYITGETSHAHYWAASDYGINVIYAGHYATETVGVKRLGRDLAQKFGVECQFFDFPTGI